MATIKYFASRNLKSGHTSGTEYTITVDLQKLDSSPKPVTVEHRSLSGYSVRTLHRIDVEYDVTTDLINADGTGTPDTDDFDEFMHSVAGGETFTFNAGSDVSVVMVGSPTRTRESVLFYTYSWKMREA